MSRIPIVAVASSSLAMAILMSSFAATGEPGKVAASNPPTDGQNGSGSAFIVASPPSTPGGHHYITPPPPSPSYRAGPISPVPPTRLTPYPPNHWHDGHWYHGDHDRRSGWWWVAGGVWFWFAVPVYPYPDPYVPPTVVIPAPPLRYWYWCDQPAGYYPYVSQCLQPWRAIPAAPPPPPPQ